MGRKTATGGCGSGDFPAEWGFFVSGGRLSLESGLVYSRFNPRWGRVDTALRDFLFPEIVQKHLTDDYTAF
ncbi:MAG: hypothetical protein AAF787_19890, partial [Chloroflexota bacterium]